MVFHTSAPVVLGSLIWYFSAQEVPFHAIALALLGLLLPFSAELYLFLENDFEAAPYTIAGWFAPGITEGQQLQRIQKFVENFGCCDDSGISRKACFVCRQELQL